MVTKQLENLLKEMPRAVEVRLCHSSDCCQLVNMWRFNVGALPTAGSVGFSSLLECHLAPALKWFDFSILPYPVCLYLTQSVLFKYQVSGPCRLPSLVWLNSFYQNKIQAQSELITLVATGVHFCH